MHNTQELPNNSRFGIVGASKRPNEQVKHGLVGAGCIWQAPSPYWILKPVDMRRILFTHARSRTVHNTPNHSNSSWFRMDSAGKCSNGRVKNGPECASCLCKLHRHIRCSNRWICAISHTHVLCTIFKNFQIPAGVGWMELAHASTSVHSTGQ